MTPLLLNININFYISETPIFHPESNNYIFKPTKVKYTTFEDQQLQVSTLHIIKRIGHYDLGYTKKITEMHFSYFCCFKYNEKHYDKLNRRDCGYALKDDSQKCKECHQENSMKIKFADLPGNVCKNCIQIYINEIMQQRVKYFINEQYLNLECNYLLNMNIRLLQTNTFQRLPVI